jgi:uncharacterized protein (TIGR00369 family)
VSDDPLATVRSRTQGNLFWRYLGVDVEDARPGWIRLRVAVREDLCNAPRAPLHGGVYASLIDMAVGGALATFGTAAGGGVDQTTLDLNVSFIGAAREGDAVVAEGRILKRGRSIAFGEATITDGGGRLLAAGRATYMILNAERKPQ